MIRRRVFLSLGVLALTLGVTVPTVYAQSSGGGWPSTDTGYLRCSPASNYEQMNDIGIKFTAYGGKSRWSVVPTGWVRVGNVSDLFTGLELYACTPWYFTQAVSTFSFKFVSWDGLVDQFDCHDFFSWVGGGPTWDLEGTRGKTRNYWTWLNNECNW